MAILQHKVAISVDSKYVIKIIFLNLHVNSFFFFRLLISCLKMVFQMLLQITLCVYPINGMINIMLVLLMGILEFCTCYCRFLDDFAQSSHVYKIRKNYFGLSQESHLYGVKVQCPKTPKSIKIKIRLCVYEIVLTLSLFIFTRKQNGSFSKFCIFAFLQLDIFLI